MLDASKRDGMRAEKGELGKERSGNADSKCRPACREIPGGVPDRAAAWSRPVGRGVSGAAALAGPHGHHYHVQLPRGTIGPGTRAVYYSSCPGKNNARQTHTPDYSSNL